MKVVLLQDIKGVGTKGDIKIVKEGYARNFLLPNKLATDANSQSAKTLQANVTLLKEKKDSQKSHLLEEAEKINKKEITVEAKTNPLGKFYGQIDSDELKKKFVISDELFNKITWPKIENAGQFKVDFKIDNQDFSVKITAKSQTK